MKTLVLAAVLWVLAGCSSQDTLPTGACPIEGDTGPPLSPDAAHLVVANSLGETWWAATLGEQATPINTTGLTGQVPNDVDVAGDRLVVVNSGDNTVSVVDPLTGRTLGCIQIGAGSNPWELTVDPTDANRAWVTTFVSGEVVELDLAAMRVVRRVTVGPALEGIWAGVDRLAVTLTGFNGTEGDYGQGYVVLLRIPDLVELARHPVPTNPQSIVLGRDERLHVICTGNNQRDTDNGRVVRLNAEGSAVLDTLDLGGGPARAVVDEDGIAYVTGFWGGVRAYDTLTLRTVSLGTDDRLTVPGYTGIALWEERLYLGNFDADAVIVLDTRSLVVTQEMIARGDGPIALTVVPARVP